ncbi:MAG TPA: GlxA family transcriptional regulator [Rhizomicrobium sp.]|nr:GlxA family transcriptional regulator [Rhizomicrobium sp.]
MGMKRIGFVGYDGVSALDLFGPLEVFDTANTRSPDAQCSYHPVVLSPTGAPFMLEQRVQVTPHAALADALPLHTVIVPGGSGARDSDKTRLVANWLRANKNKFVRIASVCTGIYFLAEAGLLDGKRATTHWRFASDVARKYPHIVIQPDAICIRDGQIATSAGVTAGIDLALALVQEDLGNETALSIARDLVVYLRRSGGQMQFSEPLQLQIRVGDRFAELADWMSDHLRDDLSVNALAQHARLSPRQFSRRFRAAFGTSPGDYVERLRLDEARRRLPAGGQTVESIAASVGYASDDAFRRAFERHFGVAPSTYREQFSLRKQAP